MPAPPPPRRWRRRLLQAILGTLTGLILAEVGFDLRDHGAFPHLHLYESDPALGVRLRPNASQRLALRNGPVTTLTTNALGYRGDDWPPSTVDEMFVVGDSQVFGLGVEQDQTFAARLARLDEDHRAVLNAGVPTYGPLEYELVARELLEKRVPKDANAKLARRTMIVVFNVGNDLLEATAPNATRHAVWDGWVVRKENAPSSPPFAFPGRRWLMSESHAMYALRSFVFRRPTPAAPESAVPDFSQPLATAGIAHDDAAQQTAQLARVWIDELERAGKDHAAAEASLQRLVQKLPRLLPGDAYGAEYRRTKGDPGDIVENGRTFFEGSPEGHDTAYLVKGAAVRAHVERVIAEAAAKELGDPDAKALTETFAARSKLELRLGELRRKAFAAVQAASPLEASLRRLKDLCDKNLARLVVVVLPVDVQVFPEAWKKYGRPPLDMKPTRVLNQDLVASARRLGLDVLDAHDALLAAGPSVFLADDPHLSATRARGPGRGAGRDARVEARAARADPDRAAALADLDPLAGPVAARARPRGQQGRVHQLVARVPRRGSQRRGRAVGALERRAAAGVPGQAHRRVVPRRVYRDGGCAGPSRDPRPRALGRHAGVGRLDGGHPARRGGARAAPDAQVAGGRRLPLRRSGPLAGGRVPPVRQRQERDGDLRVVAAVRGAAPAV